MEYLEVIKSLTSENSQKTLFVKYTPVEAKIDYYKDVYVSFSVEPQEVRDAVIETIQLLLPDATAEWNTDKNLLELRKKCGIHERAHIRAYFELISNRYPKLLVY